MTDKSQNEFNEILKDFDPQIQQLANASRDLIFEVLPQTVEVVWTKQKIAGYGTGPKKMTEHFSWIAPYKKHVVLGFNYGSELADPENLLEGTGKLMRHVKIKHIEDVHNPDVRALLEQAIHHRVPPPRDS